MPGKSTGSTGPDRRIQDILKGDVEAYVRWAEMRIHNLERNREYLKKQARVAEQRCAATELKHTMAMESEEAQRVRAETAEKRLAQAEAHLAEMAAKRQGATNRPLEKAIVKLARHPVVVKQLVLVCHPDKCPSEVSDSAGELFRFVQSIREKL
eukprot:2570455-Prymnesium_polylepis.1